MKGSESAQTGHYPHGRESVPLPFRHPGSSAEADAWFIIRTGRPVGLYRDRNGRGGQYYSLKYRVGGGSTSASWYVGQLSGAVVQAMREEIARRKAEDAPGSPMFKLPTEQVKMLGQLVRSAKQMADGIARRCGWKFKGYTLKGDTYADGHG